MNYAYILIATTAGGLITFFVSEWVIRRRAKASWVLEREVYIGIIEDLRAANKTLLDRALAEKGLPPTDINMAEKYEEREAKKRESKPRRIDPLDPLKQKWTQEDLQAKQRGRDVTKIQRAS